MSALPSEVKSTTPIPASGLDASKTGAETQAPSRPPTWTETRARLARQGFNDDDMEAARGLYFDKIVAPRFEAADLPAVRQAFDEKTVPGFLERAGKVGSAIERAADLGARFSPTPAGIVANIKAAGRTPYDDTIAEAAKANGLRPDLLHSLIRAESGFNPAAKSSKGAIGLGQLMPDTAKELGVDPADPVQNIYGSARYLRQMIDATGDEKLGVAAYNAGLRRVREYRGIPPFKETQDYVQRVMGNAGSPTAEDYARLAGASAANAIPSLVSGAGHIAIGAGRAARRALNLPIRLDQEGPITRGIQATIDWLDETIKQNQELGYQGMTEPGREQLLSGKIVEEGPDGWKLGEHPGTALASAVIQSAPSYALIGQSGGAFGSAMKSIGITPELIASRAMGAGVPAGVAEWAGKLLHSGVTYGGAEGVISGAQDAQQFYEEAMRKPIALYMKEPAWRKAFMDQTDRKLPLFDRAKQATRLLADQGALEVGAKSAAVVGGISMATGGGAFAALEKPARTALGGFAKGFGVEAMQEAPQSGYEQYAQNVAMQKYISPQQSTTEDVANATISGGLAGGVMGGPIGAVSSGYENKGEALADLLNRSVEKGQWAGTPADVAAQRFAREGQLQTGNVPAPTTAAAASQPAPAEPAATGLAQPPAAPGAPGQPPALDLSPEEQAQLDAIASGEEPALPPETAPKPVEQPKAAESRKPAKVTPAVSTEEIPDDTTGVILNGVGVGFSTPAWVEKSIKKRGLKKADFEIKQNAAGLWFGVPRAGGGAGGPPVAPEQAAGQSAATGEPGHGERTKERRGREEVLVPSAGAPAPAEPKPTRRWDLASDEALDLALEQAKEHLRGASESTERVLKAHLTAIRAEQLRRERAEQESNEPIWQEPAKAGQPAIGRLGNRHVKILPEGKGWNVFFAEREGSHYKGEPASGFFAGIKAARAAANEYLRSGKTPSTQQQAPEHEQGENQAPQEGEQQAAQALAAYRIEEGPNNTFFVHGLNAIAPIGEIQDSLKAAGLPVGSIAGQALRFNNLRRNGVLGHLDALAAKPATEKTNAEEVRSHQEQSAEIGQAGEGSQVDRGSDVRRRGEDRAGTQPTGEESAARPQKIAADKYGEILSPGDFVYLGGGSRARVHAINDDGTVQLSGVDLPENQRDAYIPGRLEKAPPSVEAEPKAKPVKAREGEGDAGKPAAETVPTPAAGAATSKPTGAQAPVSASVSPRTWPETVGPFKTAARVNKEIVKAGAKPADYTVRKGEDGQFRGALRDEVALNVLDGRIAFAKQLLECLHA